MLPVRRSTSTVANSRFKEIDAEPGERNVAWITRACHPVRGLGSTGDVILFGGSSLADFRIRVAQSHVRDDLTPSYWSLVGVRDEEDNLLTAPIWPLSPPDYVPKMNGIMKLPLQHFDDPELWPNVGVIRFPLDRKRPQPVDRLRSLVGQRPIVDIPSLTLQWLAFVWGTGNAPNPLIANHGLPSAVLVETAFGMAEIELTPGLASSSSCPEAIYQSAKWWHEFYADVAGATGSTASGSWPTGRYALRQKAATYREPDPPEL
jgi:hypothetical protein